MIENKRKKNFKNKPSLFSKEILYIFGCLTILFILCIYGELDLHKKHTFPQQQKKSFGQMNLSTNLQKIKVYHINKDELAQNIFPKIDLESNLNKNKKQFQTFQQKNLKEIKNNQVHNNLKEIRFQSQNKLNNKQMIQLNNKISNIPLNPFSKLLYLQNKLNTKNTLQKPQNTTLVKINKIHQQTQKQKKQREIKMNNQQKSSQIKLVAGVSQQQIQLAKKLSKLQQINQQKQYQQLIEKQRKYYEEKYHISQFEEQPFCIVVPSFNNSAGDRYLHNLNSILQQNYSNYHIVFIDDSSTDNTPFKVRRFAAEHQISEEKLKIIVNKQRLMAMPNLYRAAKQFCQPYQIFMVIDGDDYLVGKQVLKLYNALFQSKDYWLVYTNFITMIGTMGYSRAYPSYIIEKGQFRRAGFSISHLRAFYTKLFTLVKQEDLKDDKGKWFRAANDVAMYMPILEMAQKKFSYVPQLCYLYNSNTGLNNHINKREQQRGNQGIIKRKPYYPLLTDLFSQQQKQQLKNNLNTKINIKDLNLPQPQYEVKKYKWE